MEVLGSVGGSTFGLGMLICCWGVVTLIVLILKPTKPQ